MLARARVVAHLLRLIVAHLNLVVAPPARQPRPAMLNDKVEQVEATVSSNKQRSRSNRNK